MASRPRLGSQRPGEAGTSDVRPLTGGTTWLTVSVSTGHVTKAPVHSTQKQGGTRPRGCGGPWLGSDGRQPGGPARPHGHSRCHHRRARADSPRAGAGQGGCSAGTPREGCRCKAGSGPRAGISAVPVGGRRAATNPDPVAIPQVPAASPSLGPACWAGDACSARHSRFLEKPSWGALASSSSVLPGGPPCRAPSAWLD